MERKDWTAYRWAKEAKVNQSNISRALDPDSTLVTSIPVLMKLAAAAGEKPPIAQLLANSPVPSEEILEIVLTELLGPRLPAKTLEELELQELAGVLHDALALFEAEPSILADPDHVRIAVKSLTFRS